MTCTETLRLAVIGTLSILMLVQLLVLMFNDKAKMTVWGCILDVTWIVMIVAELLYSSNK